ncbi:MAG: hypothetical protein R3E56_17655 [Burkholderiaceae bacterium]
MSDTTDLMQAVFAKTPLGQQEIQSRSMGLAPLVRRILVLVDGKRGGADLAALLPSGSDVGQILQELLGHGCVEAVSGGRPSATGASASPKSEGADAPAEAAEGQASIEGLPPASSRSLKDNDMARNFMINSINAIIGQNMRISLVHDIFHADSTEKLREVYHAWESSMAGTVMGAKRLPELRVKLFKVL